jgi:hypothetical protein
MFVSQKYLAEMIRVTTVVKFVVYIPVYVTRLVNVEVNIPVVHIRS